MSKTFSGLLWDSFIKVLGPFSVIVMFAVMLACWIWASDRKVPVAGPAFVVLLLLICSATFAAAARLAFREARRGPPRVKYAGPAPPGIPAARLLLLLDPCELFAQGSLASVYIVEDGFERRVGFGVVVNVQDDGRIQVALVDAYDAYEEVIEDLRAGKATAMEKTIVKPTVSADATVSAMLWSAETPDASVVTADAVLGEER